MKPSKLATNQGLLAKDRTHLANERTLLAYWRTGFASLILSAFLMRFFEIHITIVGGVLLALFAGSIFVYGWIRYQMYKRTIDRR